MENGEYMRKNRDSYLNIDMFNNEHKYKMKGVYRRRAICDQQRPVLVGIMGLENTPQQELPAQVAVSADWR